MTRVQLKRTILVWARIDIDTRKPQIEEWLNDSVLALAEGKGSQIISASTNGNSFTNQVDMSHSDWVALLGEILEHLEAGTNPVTRTVGVINRNGRGL